ncbi:MAG: hypothetical protein MUF18_20475 [Fimbriiglobus sp.]|nr:hypothetical protein [Fimbriiglobus sp.]
MARRTIATAACACLLVGLTTGTAPAQLPKSPFRPVDPVALSLDGQAWTMNFAYVTPRIAKVQTPDRGERTVWYMPYYVYNKTGAPREILPEFELVTKDPDGVVMTSLDESQPSVVEAIRKLEDPENLRKYKTSVSVAKEKIPVALPNTYPESQAVYGIAVWLDVPEKANPNNFSVYVTGLSDGLAKKEVDDGKGGTQVLISRKTLQLDFRRPSASRTDRADDIKVNDNNGLGAESWKYRETSIIPKSKGKGDGK